MQKVQEEPSENKRETKKRGSSKKNAPSPRYFTMTLKTIDIDSPAWHRLTDPLIDHYRLHMETPEAEVLEIKEINEKSYHEYSSYLLEFIHAAHDGQIDLLHEDPLSFDEWKALDHSNSH
ncbi:MAG: hypothetical protein M3Q07_21365 [Pseudobdellovibrionaceae bacterium]|nr:hypothetical protein [Pseudobdellovibrionaceae bacterium]